MLSVYYLLFSLALVLAGPFLLLSKKATRAGIMQKLGFIPESFNQAVARIPKSTPRVWFHAVSVGEFNALFPLLEKFHSEHPEYQIFVSTTTATGQEMARTRAGNFAHVLYFPLDLPWVLSKHLDLIRPNLVAIVETEIWPGFMSECTKRKINVILVNGRISPRSFQSYRRWKWFFAPVVAQFNALAVQSESEKDRYRTIAGENINVNVCGNIKLDGLKPRDAAEIDQIRQQLNLTSADRIVVAGSTHEGEESAMLSALKALDGSFRLIIAPRHPERFERVVQLIESSGFTAKRFTQQEGFTSSNDVYVLDTIGQLNKFYGLSDIAFVGGTIANVGGHNLAEPCAYKAPVICGQHIHKARDLYKKLKEREALLMVHDEKELISTIKMLLDSPAKRDLMGENGFRFLAESQGALAKTLTLLEKYLACEGIDQQMKIHTLEGARR